MLDTNDVQEAIIAQLQASTGVTALVSSDEVREMQWQGDSHEYPNIRVRVTRADPQGEAGCRGKKTRFGFEVLVSSQQTSSKQCNQIAHAVGEEMDGKQIAGSAIQSGTVELLTGGQARWNITNSLWERLLVFEVNGYG